MSKSEDMMRNGDSHRDAIKERMGIEIANCSTCESLGSDGDGYEYNGTWPVCNIHSQLSNLKSFPFKKEMKCWSPNFWHSKFAEMLKNGTDDEMAAASNAFRAALDG